MSAPPNAVPEASMNTAAVAPAPMPPARVFYWSVLREIWEYRAIYIAPLAVAGIFLFGFVISLMTLPRHTRAVLSSPDDLQKWIEHPYTLSALVVMAAALLVAIFYSLDSLHSERRDRSILFWKSLPVSDAITVLAKASIPLVVLPMVAFVTTFVLHIIMLVLTSVVLTGSGLGAGILWGHLMFVHMTVTLFYHLLFIHGFWYAPFYGWFMLVSAWAKRAPFLWATLPPLLIGILEKIIFGTTCFAWTLRNHFFGGPDAMRSGQGATTLDAMTHPGPLGYFTSPGFWIGLLVTAIFLALAVRIRRYREPI